jgi:hypothetical protein
MRILRVHDTLEACRPIRGRAARAPRVEADDAAEADVCFREEVARTAGGVEEGERGELGLQGKQGIAPLTRRQ